MNRRDFLHVNTALGLGWLTWNSDKMLGAGREKEMHADVVIVGGSLGGCAAALAACRAGMSVILVEETDWIGGQLTSQAVPPDEHPWIEQFGCTRSYRALREGIRQYYRDHFPLTPSARTQAHWNPGGGWVSRLCHEPRIALAVLQQMLAPHVAAGNLRILLQARVHRVETDGDKFSAVQIVDGRVLTAPWFVDATELGDLLALGGVEHRVGAESRRETGEPHATEEAEPLNQQAATWCFAMDYVEGADFTLDRPVRYDFWRDYIPEMTPPWTGRLLDWANTHPITLEPRTFQFDPMRPGESGNIFSYRQIAKASNYTDATYRTDVSLVNWPQNDYWLKPLIGPGVSEQDQAEALLDARQLSLSLLYWMQREAPRPDGGTGWKGLRLRHDVTDGPDGLAKSVYVRESRRIEAEFTVLEQHISTEIRMKETSRSREEVSAEKFSDSVGVGAYRIDLHPSTNQRNYVDLSSLPFQIPLGALLPKRVENLLPACKNLGVTHITNGCYRLHPVEWNIGEAVGVLLGYCRDRKHTPRAVRNRPEWLAEYQGRLRQQGVELDWPSLRPL
jgi:hypothetical protein